MDLDTPNLTPAAPFPSPIPTKPSLPLQNSGFLLSRASLQLLEQIINNLPKPTTRRALSAAPGSPAGSSGSRWIRRERLGFPRIFLPQLHANSL